VKQRLADLDPVIGLASHRGQARYEKAIFHWAYRVTRGRRGPEQSWEEAIAQALGAEELRENAQGRPPEERKYFHHLARVAERLEQNQPPSPAQSKDSFG
jgi:hypothetical protein